MYNKSLMSEGYVRKILFYLLTAEIKIIIYGCGLLRASTHAYNPKIVNKFTHHTGAGNLGKHNLSYFRWPENLSLNINISCFGWPEPNTNCINN